MALAIHIGEAVSRAQNGCRSPPIGSVKVYQGSEVIFEENSTGDGMNILRSWKVKLALGGTGVEAEVGILEQSGGFLR